MASVSTCDEHDGRSSVADGHPVPVAPIGHTSARASKRAAETGDDAGDH